MYEKIKDLCVRKGITITALERELNFAKGSLSKIDRHKPSADRLQKIADYFGVSVDFFTVQKSGQNEMYYFDDETAKAAQETLPSSPIISMIPSFIAMQALLSSARVPFPATTTPSETFPQD